MRLKILAMAMIDRACRAEAKVTRQELALVETSIIKVCDVSYRASGRHFRPRRKTTYASSVTPIETVLVQTSARCEGVSAIAISTSTIAAIAR